MVQQFSSRAWIVLRAALAVASFFAISCASTADKDDGGGGLPSARLPDATLYTYDSGTIAILGDAGTGQLVLGDGGIVTSVTISPANPTVTVAIVDGSVTSAPTVQFSAVDQSGSEVQVGWTLDQAQLGSISGTGEFTPSGETGGTANIIAGFGSSTAQTTLTVIIQRTQNGSAGPVDLGGSGGYGGVGGEGPGGPATATDIATLQQTPKADPTLAFLYPYDGTVWPRGLLAPLLQWSQGPSKASAIALHLQSKTYIYDGTFGRPAALASGAPFVRHPIPQDVWVQAVESTAGSDALSVRVTLAAQGAAVGPISETWIIAPGLLQGTVYYESYFTQLVTNAQFNFPDGGTVEGGAALLAIKPGDTGPHVVAGTNTDCRGCHSVAAKGGSLITQDTNYAVTSLYTLPLATETQLPLHDILAFAGLSPDGTLALTNTAGFPAINPDTKVELYHVGANPTVAAASGLPSNIGGATPSFSPDGTHVAFTHVSGNAGSLSGDGSHVLAMDFDPTGLAFTNPRYVFSLAEVDAGCCKCLGYPSFMPSNDSLLVEVQLSPCSTAVGGSYIGNSNVEGEIWWSDTAAGTQHRLDALNGYLPDGTSYLPADTNTNTMANPPAVFDDTKLNYQPGVGPAPSGGYAWVIFTSRRRYGNVATIAPFASDPRNAAFPYDPRTQITTKKLWMAAIDLNAKPGTDPSHPAFYLPAQELMAGNARGDWVLDPCKADGQSCTMGDQCCGGYCESAGIDGGLICASQIASCAQIGDKCSVSSDCCNSSAQCINSICSIIAPPVRAR